MDIGTQKLFEIGLECGEDWEVTDVKFESKELHLYLKAKDNRSFKCEIDGCEEKCKVYDTIEKTWRHLNFFESKTYLHIKVPRINCSKHGIQTISVPWERKDSGFSFFF
jgi:transposase